MRWPLYLLLSGSTFFVGLALVMAALVLAARPRLRSTSRIVSWAGALTVALSSVPAPWFLYATFGLAFAAWQLSETASPASRTSLLTNGSLCASVLCLGGFEAPWHVTPRVPLDPAASLVVLGDSISAGLGGSDAGTWPARIGEGLSLKVVNLSQAGATTSSALAQARGIPPGPAIVVLEIGGNDLLGGVPCVEFRSSLATLLGTVTGPERRVVMFELPLFPLQNACGQAQRELSRAHGVTLLRRRPSPTRSAPWTACISRQPGTSGWPGRSGGSSGRERRILAARAAIAADSFRNELRSSRPYRAGDSLTTSTPPRALCMPKSSSAS